MEEKTRYFLDLYDSSPTLVLFGDILDSNRESDEMTKMLKIAKAEELNPIEVVMESLVNVVAEDISRKEITCAKDRVLINNDIQDKAVETILNLVGGSRERLEKIHSLWLGCLRNYLEQLYKEMKTRKVDEIIFLVGRRFRLTSLSSIKALSSI